GGNLEDRVDESRLGVRDQQHVALLDLLVTPDARPIKSEPVGEHVIRQLSCREREMLPDSRKIDKSHIDDLDLGVLHKLLHVIGRLRHNVPPTFFETSLQQPCRTATGLSRLWSDSGWEREMQVATLVSVPIIHQLTSADGTYLNDPR